MNGLPGPVAAPDRGAVGPWCVLQVASHYPPHIGGLEIVVRETARALARRGHKVTVLTSREPGRDAREVGAPNNEAHEQGVRVLRLPAWTGFERHWGVPFPVFGPSLLTRTWREVGRADVVQVHDDLYLTSWAAALVCRLRRTPYVLTQHVGVVHHSSALVRGVQGVVASTTGAVVLRGAAAVLPIDARIERATLERDPGAPTRVLPNAADSDLFRPAEPGEKAAIREHYGLPAEQPLALFVGRFVPKKGYDIVSRAGGAGYRIVLVGGHRPPDARDDHVYLGPLTQEQVAEVYRACDVFISASVGEGPMTPIEAMASAVPVLLRDDPAHRQQGLAGEGAELVDMDPDSLRGVLTQWCADTERLAERGQAARATVLGRHSWGGYTAVLEEVYAEVTGTVGHTVAVVAPHYPPEVGGVERYAAELVRALQATPDLRPVVLTTARGARATAEIVDGVRVLRLGTWARLSNSPVNPCWWWQVPRALRRWQVQAVNAHAPVPGLADVTLLRSAAVPVVLTYHAGSLVKGELSSGVGGLVDRALGAYERWVLPRLVRRAAANIAVSPTSFNAAADSHVISGGVDTDLFQPGGSVQRTHLLFVGRIQATSRWKGLQVLLEAWPAVVEQCPEAILDVVGDGDDRRFMQALTVRLGVADRVVWHGALHHEALATAYRSALALVTPSTTHSECWPLTVVEAMASGRPVLASAVGGLPHMIDEGQDGLLVPPRDPGALAAGCVRLLRDPHAADQMGAQARRRVASMTWEQQSARSVQVLRAAMGLNRTDSSKSIGGTESTVSTSTKSEAHE